MSKKKWSRVESLLYNLECERRTKEKMLKTGMYSPIEKLSMRHRQSVSAALRQLKSDIIAIRGWFKYRKKVPF